MANRVQHFIRSVLFNSSLNANRVREMKNKKNILKTKNNMRHNQMIIQKRDFHSFNQPPMFGFGGGGGGGGDPSNIIKIMLTIISIYTCRKLMD
jgi:hypothetical protein